MSEKFVASNGVTVAISKNQLVCDGWVCEIGSAVYDALREFFQHERDAELGRWRWPESTSVVVYEESPDVLRIFEEEGGTGWVYVRGVFNAGIPAPVADAGEAYFAAHHVSKEWHDAKPGEVWALTYGGQETAHVWTDRWAGQGNAFVSDRAIVEAEDPDITAARRIWPEVVSDDS